MSAGTFTSLPGLLALTISFGLVLLLVTRFAPRKRVQLKRALLLFALYVLAASVTLVLTLVGASGAAQSARTAGELLGIIGLVHVTGFALFDLALPAVKFEVTSLIAELSLGVGYVLAILLTARAAGMDLSGILATSAVVTAILALSLQATLGNVVGGVALQIDKSIQIGEWVRLENGKEGKVREIRWRHTVLETRDWETLIVPNANLLAAQITVLGKRDHDVVQYRKWIHFQVDYRFAPGDVLRVVDEAIVGAPIEGVASEPPPRCLCLDLARDHRHGFAVYGLMYWLTNIASEEPTASRLRERLFSALARAKIPLALPSHQVFMVNDDADHAELERRREIDARVTGLSGIDLFRPLTESEVRALASDLQYSPFSAGETVMRQGEVAHSLLLLTEGKAEVRVAGPSGERAVAELTAPDVLGEMGLMTGEPRAATVVARTDLAGYRLDKDAFDRVLRARPELAGELSALLARRKIELKAAHQNLDATSKERHIEAENRRLLSVIRIFFRIDGGSGRGVA